MYLTALEFFFIPLLDSLYEKCFVMFTGSASLVSLSAIVVTLSGMKSIFDYSCNYLLLSSEPEVSLLPEWVSHYMCYSKSYTR